MYITTGCHSLTSFARYLDPVHCLPTRTCVWDLIFGVFDTTYLLIMLKAKRYLHSNGSSFQFLVDEDKAIHDGTEFDSSGVLVKAHKGRDASIVAAWKWLKIHLPKDVVTQEFIEGTGWLRSELYGI